MSVVLNHALALLAAACLASVAQGAPNFNACGEVPTYTVAVPGGTQLLNLFATGTRNYTCAAAGGMPPIGDGQGLVEANLTALDDPENKLGYIYFSPKGTSVVRLTDDQSYVRLISDSEGISPFYQPSPNNGSIAWVRWQVSESAGSLENVTYVTRVDTQGGTQDNCPELETQVEVPFTATYILYECSGAAGRAASLVAAVAAAAIMQQFLF